MPVDAILAKNKRDERGSSLIETVVALFIVAVGLLAVQAMQLSSLRTNVGAFMRTEAQLLAEDMADRIMASDDISNPGSDGVYGGVDTDDSVSDPNCASGGCSSSQQRTRNVFEWKADVEGRLPAGRGIVTATGAGYTVTVLWDNDKTGATGTNCSGDTDVDLSCYSVQLNL